MYKSISAKRVVLTSFGVDFLDVLVNVVVMFATGSVVMVAELLQGISDLFASGFLLIGLKRPKEEIRFWTLLSALMMLLVASTLSFYFGYQRFIQPEAIDNILIAYIALAISIVSNGYAFWLSVKRLLGKKGRVSNLVDEFNRSPLIMTKNTFVLDLMGMSAALVGFIALVLYQLLGDLRFDGLGAMGIGIVLALLSLRLIWDMSRMPENRLPS
jgi:divalent metal cation (Fe/Co/Zn/Cd) transporter